MKVIGFILICLAGVLGFLYINLYWGLYEPIVSIITMIGEGEITPSVVGWEIIKFFVKEILGFVWLFLCYIVAMTILKD
jgi:hypothetical protein